VKWKIIFAFVFLLRWLCFPGNAGAQQGYCFNSNFSSYTNDSISSDGASIIQTVQESGYITLNNPSVWAGPLTGWIYPCTTQNNQMQSSTHTYSIQNVIGSTGGNYSQGPTPALNYNTYSITITATAAPGTVYTSGTNAEVVCVIAGPIFGGPPPPPPGSVELVHANYDLYLNGGCAAPFGNVSQTCIVRKNCQSGTESCPGPAQDTVTKDTCGCGQHFDRITLKIKNLCVPGANRYVDIGTLVVPCS
jgi:hypothetical protein